MIDIDICQKFKFTIELAACYYEAQHQLRFLILLHTQETSTFSRPRVAALSLSGRDFLEAIPMPGVTSGCTCDSCHSRGQKIDSTLPVVRVARTIMLMTYTKIESLAFVLGDC